MLTKGQLKEMLSVADAAGVPDSVEVKMQRLDLVRLELDGGHFILEGQDASYSINAADHWAPSVSQPASMILKQV